MDCQGEDYAGWPEGEGELPVKYLSEENRKVIVEKCSVQEVRCTVFLITFVV